MSFKAAAWAISEDMTRSTAEKMVLIILADCHNAETGRCDPSHDFIANRARMSRRNVIRVLEQLEQIGVITQKKRSNGAGLKQTTYYSLACDTMSHRCDKSSTNDVTNGTPTDVTPCHINQEYINQEYNQGARARVCPAEFQPPDKQTLALMGVPPDVDVSQCLKLFRLHTFERPVSDWTRAFATWCIRESTFRKPASSAPTAVMDDL